MGKSKHNYVEEGSPTGKMDGDELGMFRLECPCYLGGERITEGGKGAMKTGGAWVVGSLTS